MDFRRCRSNSDEDFENREKESDCWKLFRPFPRQTSTLIAGPSFIGKSTYVKKLVEYQHIFFQDTVTRLVVVNCNDSVTFPPLEEPQDESQLRRPLATLVQRTWQDFEVGDLEQCDVLVIDDLQKVTQQVRDIVNAATHHLGLAHCFVITHSVLGSRQYELLNLVHRIALFCSSTSVSNLANYVLSTRILDPDLKTRLKEALGSAQRSREVLVLELSALPESVQPYHVACSHLLRLTDPKFGYALVYPHPSRAEMYEQEADDIAAVEMKSPDQASKNLPGNGDFVAGSFLVLRPEMVAALKKKKSKVGKTGAGSEEDSGDDQVCLDKDEKLWNRTVLQMESDVENFLPSKQWRACKSLLYELLHNPSLCLTKEGRRITLHDRPGVVASLIDYLTAATRRDAPTERRVKSQTPEFKAFRQITAALLAGDSPKSLFKNRLVLPSPSESRRAAPEARGESSSQQKPRKMKKKKKKKKRMKADDDFGEPSPTSSNGDLDIGDLDFSVLH
jgi:hypothetical protein